MKATIAVAAGDGVGKEVVPQGTKALRAVERRFRHKFDLRPIDIGFEWWKDTGQVVTREALETCRSSQGVLLGALGAGDWQPSEGKRPPSWGRSQLVTELGYCASIRPAHVFAELEDATPVKPERIHGADLVIVREGRSSSKLKQQKATLRQTKRGWCSSYELKFYEDEITPVLKCSFLLAQGRRKKLTLMAQPSVFQTSRLWQQLFEQMAQKFLDVETDVLAPDNCAMQLIRNAREFDVIVCDSSTMGGILNNLAGLIMGSVGMAPGATVALQDGSTFRQTIVPNGVYEPIHGTAPKRAGQWVVNPIGTVLAAAMLLRYSLHLEDEARAVERAVEETLARGYRTYDIMQPGKTRVGTAEMGDLIASAIETDS